MGGHGGVIGGKGGGTYGGLGGWLVSQLTLTVSMAMSPV